MGTIRDPRILSLVTRSNALQQRSRELHDKALALSRRLADLLRTSPRELQKPKPAPMKARPSARLEQTTMLAEPTERLCGAIDDGA